MCRCDKYRRSGSCDTPLHHSCRSTGHSHFTSVTMEMRLLILIAVASTMTSCVTSEDAPLEMVDCVHCSPEDCEVGEITCCNDCRETRNRGRCMLPEEILVLPGIMCITDCQKDKDCGDTLKCCKTSCGGRKCSHPRQKNASDENVVDLTNA